jgi:hypothetical protein
MDSDDIADRLPKAIGQASRAKERFEFTDAACGLQGE